MTSRRLRAIRKTDDAELWKLRQQYLERQLSALRARLDMLQGKRLTFDEESQALYDAVAPRHTEAEFAGVLAKLERQASRRRARSSARYEQFKRAFIIPRDRLDARLPGRDSGVPRPHAHLRRAAAGGELHGRVRDRASRGAATTGIKATIAA